MQRKDSTDHDDCVTEHTHDGNKEELDAQLTLLRFIVQPEFDEEAASCLLLPSTCGVHDVRRSPQLLTKVLPTVQNATRSPTILHRALALRRFKM
jgi:hypothetical protein